MKAVIPARTVTTGFISLSSTTLQIDFFYLAVLKVESSLARVKNMPAPIALLVAVNTKIFMLGAAFRASDRFVITRVVHFILLSTTLRKISLNKNRLIQSFSHKFYN